MTTRRSCSGPCDAADAPSMNSDLKAEEGAAWADMSREEKNHRLFLRQKELLALFLANGAITRAQHDKSLRDLTEKTGQSE